MDYGFLVVFQGGESFGDVFLFFCVFPGGRIDVKIGSCLGCFLLS